MRLQFALRHGSDVSQHEIDYFLAWASFTVFTCFAALALNFFSQLLQHSQTSVPSWVTLNGVISPLPSFSPETTQVVSG